MNVDLARMAPEVFSPDSGWVCHRVALGDDGETLRVGFSQPTSDSWVEIDFARLNPKVSAFQRYAQCQVAYHGNFTSADSEAEALALTGRLASFVDAGLSAAPAQSFHALDGRIIVHAPDGAEDDAPIDALIDVPPDTLPVPRAEALEPLDRVILSLSSPCHQECSFCSLKTLWKTDESIDSMLARVVDELRDGRRRGAAAMVLNGFDPLAFPRVLDVLDAAKALGYQHAEIYSPCTLLADRQFCADVVSRLPTSHRVHVPLYALDAAIHDDIVGRAGSYDKVMTALDHLRALLAPEAITITTVATRQTLPLVPPLLRFALDQQLDLFSTMPYPATNADDDRFIDASPRQSEAAAVLVDALADTPQWIGAATVGIAPCVVFARARERGLATSQWLAASVERPRLNGGPTPRKVPCRHAAACVLAQACPGEFFERYVAVFGDDEFRPVGLYDLLRSLGAAERPSDGSARRTAPGTSPRRD